MCEGERGTNSVDNERGSRHGGEIPVGSQSVPAVAYRDAANVATRGSRGGSREW
jgi:hypothetical protein